MYISEVPKFSAETPSETTHALELVDPFDATHPLIIPLQLCGVTSYFDVFSPSIAEYEDEDIPKIHLTAEESSWDLSASKYSQQETQMIDHQGQINITATAERGQVIVRVVVSYSLAYDVADVMDDDNLESALEAQI